MATFDGAGFSERGQGGGLFFPIHGIKINVAILKVPGGAKTYLQPLQVPPTPFDCPAQMTASQLAAMRGKVGVSGTLAYSFGSFTATLESVDGPVEVKRGQDYWQGTLKFQVTDAFP